MKWCLIGKVADGEPAQAVPIASDLFAIGRREAVSLRIHLFGQFELVKEAAKWADVIKRSGAKVE